MRAPPPLPSFHSTLWVSKKKGEKLGIETKERRRQKGKRERKKDVVEATSLAFPHISRSKRSDAMALFSVVVVYGTDRPLLILSPCVIAGLFPVFFPSITYLGRRGKRRAAADVFSVVFWREFTNLSPEGVGGRRRREVSSFSGNKRSSGSKRSRGNTTGDERGR